MNWIAYGTVLLALAVLIWILHVRRSSITGEKSRNKHFRMLAEKLGYRFVTDDYFVQLEGSIQNQRVIVYPHNFEGPGFVTLLYMETNVPAEDRNWIEPNLSLGRALVENKKGVSHNFEVTGTQLPATNILSALLAMKQKYPYAAVTLPWRFSYSPLLQKSLLSWKNYVVFLAMDAGRHPSSEQLSAALEDAHTVSQSVTFSETTG